MKERAQLAIIITTLFDSGEILDRGISREENSATVQSSTSWFGVM
jgi:hypothetical protein